MRQRAVGTCHSLGLDAEEAEDIAQDAMLKLWTVRASVSGIRHAEGLLVSIAKHLCIDFLRKRRTVPIDGLKAVIDESRQSPQADMEDEENERWVEQKLKTLPATEYTVLHLRQVEHKSREEIASIVGIAPSSVGTLLSRARKKMLEEIKRSNRI